MNKLFFLLSGEHPTLPFSEITSILEAEGYTYKSVGRLRQVLRLQSDKNAVEPIISRTAMTRMCCEEFFECAAKVADVDEALRRTSLDGTIEKGEGFAVRVKKIGGVSREVNSVDMERKLGKTILEKVQGARVRLKTPTRTFLGVFTENRFVFGLKLKENPTKTFSERRPRKRPFFQPSAMPAKLARCMVNLTRAKRDNIVFDPFCGTGTFLIEAGLIGCRVIGCDAQRHMVEGTVRNLRHYTVKPEATLVADAAHSPITMADCIVTDPPYGRTASTLGESTEQIVRKVLPKFEELLKKKSRICMASPKAINIGKIAVNAGFKHLESHYVYVHRSLTREIAVLEKA